MEDVFYKKGIFNDFKDLEGVSFLDLPHKKISKKCIAKNNPNLIKGLHEHFDNKFSKHKWVFESINISQLSILEQNYIIVNTQNEKHGTFT